MTEKAAFPAPWINELVAKHPLPWSTIKAHVLDDDAIDVYDACGAYVGRKAMRDFTDIVMANIVVTRAKIAAEERNG